MRTDRIGRGRSGRAGAAMLAALALVVAGCASPGGIAPKATLMAPPSPATTAAPAPIGGDWWRAFGDPALDALVERALADQPSLRVAAARFDRAAAGSDAARAADAPRVAGVVNASRQRYSENGLLPPPIAGSTQTVAEVHAALSWELDFFGRRRAALDAALGSERAAAADAQAARVLLAAQVARQYVQLARLVEQRAVALQSLGQRSEILALVRQRVGAGLDTNVELRQSEGALPDSRAQIEAIDEQIVLARHALAALSAQPPDALDALAPSFAGLGAVPLPDAVPADLLGRRADVAAARARVDAAGGDVAAARAEFYPSVNLVALVGLNTLGLDRLVQAGSRELNVGPAISLPLFDAGRLRAALGARTADLDAAVESYNAALIDALHDAGDQVASLRAIGRQQREQRDAQASAESAYDLARQRYRAGIGGYLTVLSAEAGVLAQRRQSVDLKAREFDAQIALIRALGGGYLAPQAARERPAGA